METRHRQMVELYLAGAKIADLAREYNVPVPRVWSLLIERGALTLERLRDEETQT